MGAEQSSARGSSRSEPAVTTEKKTCYYELLGVPRTATDEEIKKAYRRKALELHPDRNYGDVENATKLFAEIQAANEVLSDPQERAWYDSHRDAILNNESANEYTQGQNIQVTSATKLVNLMGKFNSSTPFTNTPDGFYGSLRHIFQTLADEEYAACEWEGLEPVDYPDFGSKDDIDNYEEVVRPFYAVWTNFSTKKTFSWKDVHRLSEAPDRYIRRLMEKENKQLREKAIREFNDTVRSLALFARKRDPRYRPNTQSEADRQKALRDASLAQAKKARAANAAKLAARVVPEWTKSREDELEDNVIFSESESSEEELVLRCDFCNKTFKSEQQFEAHEKSKKHIRIMQQVKRQMQKENKKFGFDEELGSSGISTPAFIDAEEEIEAEEDLPVQEEEELDHVEEDKDHTEVQPEPEDEPSTAQDQAPNTGENVEKTTPPEPIKSPSSPEAEASEPSESESEEDEDYAPRSKVTSRLTTQDPLNPLTSSLTSLSLSVSETSEPSSSTTKPALGKAKAKRAKKLAAQQASATGEHLCGVCKEGFPSKTKLFKHVKDEGHAVGVGGGVGVGAGKGDDWGGKGKGKKKRK